MLNLSQQEVGHPVSIADRGTHNSFMLSERARAAEDACMLIALDVVRGQFKGICESYKQDSGEIFHCRYDCCL